MKTPIDKEITFTFMSHPTKDLAMRWTARLKFPAGSEGESILPIEIVDGNEVPVEKGIFEFAGQRLEVKGGHTEIKYSAFIAGSHETALWLYRKGMMPIPGGLTFA